MKETVNDLERTHVKYVCIKQSVNDLEHTQEMVSIKDKLIQRYKAFIGSSKKGKKLVYLYMCVFMFYIQLHNPGIHSICKASRNYTGNI